MLGQSAALARGRSRVLGAAQEAAFAVLCVWFGQIASVLQTLVATGQGAVEGVGHAQIEALRREVVDPRRAARLGDDGGRVRGEPLGGGA